MTQSKNANGTKRIMTKLTCPACGGDLSECKHCGASVDTFTPFSKWLRKLEAPLNGKHVSLQNLDFIWFSYLQDWIITMEEKRNGADSDWSQCGNHGVLTQMLTRGSGQIYRTLRGPKPVEYRGHYIVSFEKTSPDDSAWIKINGTKFMGDLGREKLMSLLKRGQALQVRRSPVQFERVFTQAESKMGLTKTDVIMALTAPRQMALFPEVRQQALPFGEQESADKDAKAAS